MSVKAQNSKETFVFFKQLSMDFIPSDTKTNSRIKHRADENHELQLQFAIYYPVRTLLLEFRHALKYDGFKCIEMGDRQLLIIRSKISDRFKKLFLCRQPPKFILTITTHEFLSVRTVTIKPLKSNSNFSGKNISVEELSTEVNHIGELLLGLRTLNQASSSEVNELENEYRQDFFSLDATAYYMFTRMLVQSNYSLGKKILTVFNKFKGEKNLENCGKNDIHWLHEALNEISDDLLQGFNCSRKELLEILAYCRKSVEQYLHNIHHQQQANIGRLYLYDSQGFTKEMRELDRIVPETLKQFLNLERSRTSMEIFRVLFMIKLIFKAQLQVKGLSEEEITRVRHLIRLCFSAVINEKTRFLKCFGYSEEICERYTHLFNFNHEVTF